MSAAQLQRVATLPVAAVPVAVGGGSGASGVSSPSAGHAAAAAKAAPATGPAADGSVPAEAALQAIVSQLEGTLTNPVIAADGTVYMERQSPVDAGGHFALQYVIVGTIDMKTKRMKVAPKILEAIKAKVDKEQAKEPERKLVKVDDQYVWQVFSKTADGKVVAEVTPATKEELEAMQAQQAEAAAKAKLENRADWQQKLGTINQNLGLFTSTAGVVSGLAAGPNTYTGKPGTGWMQGWFLAQRLNGKAGGTLLPQWLQKGPISIVMEWAIQGYGMLDMGNDFRTVRNYFAGKPPVGIALEPAAAAAKLVAQGVEPGLAAELAQTGVQLRVGEAALRQGQLAGLSPVSPTGDIAVRNMLLEGEAKGAAQLLTKADVKAAYEATDPMQSAGTHLRGQIDTGITRGLGLLKGLVQPALIGAAALGAVSNTITVRNMVAQNGAKVLLDEQQGRGALLGAISSAAFLGVYLVPMVLPQLGVASAAVSAAASAVNIASNIIGGVQMLNSYGLFGGNGFLNHDALRGAFLIPPLTPIGAFAFAMDRRKKRAEAEAAKLAAAKQVAIERVKQQSEMARLQLQKTGTVAGATKSEGGLIVSTTIPTDMAQLAAQLSGAGAPAAAGAPASAPPAAAAS